MSRNSGVVKDRRAPRVYRADDAAEAAALPARAARSSRYRTEWSCRPGNRSRRDRPWQSKGGRDSPPSLGTARRLRLPGYRVGRASPSSPRTVGNSTWLSGMRLFACLIVAPQRGYDEPAILSYAISSFCPTSAEGLQFALWPAEVCHMRNVSAHVLVPAAMFSAAMPVRTPDIRAVNDPAML